jgi:hypothetical protein
MPPFIKATSLKYCERDMSWPSDPEKVSPVVPAEIERERPAGILLFGRSNLRRLSDRSLPIDPYSAAPPAYLKGGRSSVKQTMQRSADSRH